LDRERAPGGRDRIGQLGEKRDFSEWLYRLLEASFCVENELEYEPRHRERADELRRRRNAVMDELGENEHVRRAH
jgi:hypothetical protein